MSEKTNITIEDQSNPAERLPLTKRGRVVSYIGATAAALALSIPVATAEGNPVGESVHAVLDAGLSGLDKLPGVDIPDRE